MIEIDHTISRPAENATLRVLSLGAGVQSSVIALLASRGLIGPMPDCAIFSDTGWEPKEVYDHLDWLTAQLAFPVYRVSNGNIRESVIHQNSQGSARFASIPFFIKSESGVGMGRRQCTNEFKIVPIVRKIRDLCGLDKGERAKTKGILVEQWFGISWDEIQRMKNPREKWIHGRWPLIEMKWRRFHCLEWWNKEYPNRHLPKSSCIGCPYHDNAWWRHLRDTSPQEWQDAVAIDKIIRTGGQSRGLRGMQYMHQSMMPLDQAPIDNDQSQHRFDFNSECEGMCGT